VCRFGKGEELREHLERKHTEGGIKCGECPQRLLGRREMRVHKARVHGGELPYKCPECGERKGSSGALSIHMASVHNRDDGRRRVTWEVCKKTLNHDYFSTRMKIHLEVKDKVCHFCGKAFVRRECLEMHLRVHTG